MKCISILNKKFTEEIKSNKVKIKYANIGNKNDVVIIDNITNKIQYDVIFHINSFYFWDNLKNCGYHLDKLLAKNGCIVAGFRWRGLSGLPKNIYKYQQQSDYLD